MGRLRVGKVKVNVDIIIYLILTRGKMFFRGEDENERRGNILTLTKRYKFTKNIAYKVGYECIYYIKIIYFLLMSELVRLKVISYKLLPVVTTTNTTMINYYKTELFLYRGVLWYYVI